MPFLTREFLAELDIKLDDASYEALADHFESTLHERVINEIIEELTPEQAEQLAQMQQSDDESLQAWLKQTVPDLSDIVSDEVDILLGEIAENSDAMSDV